MKKSLMDAMFRMYGQDNEWAVLFASLVADFDDTDMGDRQLIRQKFAYCDLNAAADRRGWRRLP